MMDTIYQAIAKLEREDDEERAAASGPVSGTRSAEIPVAGRALVPIVQSLERLNEGSWALTCRHGTITSTPFTLDELRLERLLAPEQSKGCYEELVANFHSHYDAESIRTVLFVGTGQGEGCSTTAFNFAVALARSPHTAVLYIDADFRATRLPTQRATSVVPALSNLALPGRDGLLPVVPLKDFENLFVAPSGDATVAPMTLFRSLAFETFMSEMSSRFSHVVIDAPPLQAAPETLFLAGKADGVVLVLDCNRSRLKIARRLKEKIESAGGRLLGAVLNQRRYYIPEWLYRKL